MAVKLPGPKTEKPVRDVDDEIADRRPGKKPGVAGGPAGARRAPPPKAVPRKPGHVIDTAGDQAEEQVADPEGLAKSPASAREAEADPKKKKKTAEAKRRGPVDPDEERSRRRPAKPEPEPEAAPKAPSTTAGHLALDSNYFRSQTARRMGFEQTPSVGDFVTGLDSPEEGETLGALLPSARARAHPDLPDTDVRPPDFLSPLEAMKDIWMRTRGRMTRRTQELLEGPDLEDLLEMVRGIHDDDVLVKKPEARIVTKLYKPLADDPGPLLLGLHDPRLTEVWRLILDGWEVWIPDGEEHGVELFWEGEAEEDDGRPMEIVQSLAFLDGELSLSTKMGEIEDTVTFDGEAFYRLKTSRRAPSPDESV